MARARSPLWLVLVVAAPACSGDVADDTFLLGAGAVLDRTADTLDDAQVADGDVDGVESVAASDGSWSGVVPVELASADDLGLDCDGTPCPRAWTARLTLDDVVLHDGGRAAEADASFDCAPGGFGEDRCDDTFGFDPPDVHLDGVLEVEVGWRQAEHSAGETTRFFHLATRDAASLRAHGFALERTASVSVTYDADWDEYSGHVRVTGTVDGAAGAYDYGWTD